MKILGIDQSFNSTGYVVLNDDQMIDFKCIQPIRDLKNKNLSKLFRAEYARSKILKVIEKHNPDRVHIEQLAYSAAGSVAKDLGGLFYILAVEIEIVLKIPLHIIPPTSLKKFATGCGTAKKRDMIAQLPLPIINQFEQANYKKTTGLSDLADAYWLSKFNRF